MISTTIYFTVKKRFILCLFLFLSVSCFSQQSFTIRQLPSGDYKISNNSNPLNTWTVYKQVDGSLKFVNDNDPLDSFTSRVNVDGSRTTYSDSDILSSFTTNRNVDGSYTTRNNQNLLESSTTSRNVDGSYTTRNNQNLLESSTTRRNVDGSYTTSSYTSSLPNVTANSQTSTGLPNVTNNTQAYSDTGAYANPKMVRATPVDEETNEAIAAGAAAAVLLVAQFGSGIGLSVGLDNGNPSYGIDIYFKGISIGYQYSQFSDGEYTSYNYDGSPLYTDINNIYLNAGTIGFSISKKSPSLMIKTSIGSWYDDEGLLDYEANELYYRVGLQNSFGKKERSGITGEVFMSSFGLGGAIGYIISFNRK